MNKIQNNQYKKGDLTKKILLAIAGITSVAALLTIAAIAPNAFQMLKLFDLGDKRKIKKRLKKLEEEKFVEIFDKDDETFIRITEKGKERILKYNLEEMKIKRPGKWDGFWRIIAFDIPEKHKKARDALRMKLKELGFLKLHDSVFIFPFHCKDEIDFIAEIFNIRKYINYIEAKTIENDWKLKNHFRI